MRTTKEVSLRPEAMKQYERLLRLDLIRTVKGVAKTKDQYATFMDRKVAEAIRKIEDMGLEKGNRKLEDEVRRMEREQHARGRTKVEKRTDVAQPKKRAQPKTGYEFGTTEMLPSAFQPPDVPKLLEGGRTTQPLLKIKKEH